jgi:ADP-ribosyl-[dinitrogen reductase] hydrolase
MLGSLIGDIIGSVYEWHATNSLDFPLFNNHSTFTDDSVLTIATAHWLLDGGDYAQLIKNYTRRFPKRGYGSSFYRWAISENQAPYHSFGNGSAMRVSPVGFAFSNENEVLAKAKESAMVTHNHPEGVKGAQSVALAIYLARQGKSKKEIKTRLEKEFNYNLSRSYTEIQGNYGFDVTCQGSVPEAIIAFLSSNNYEEAIRKAICLGGDADTQACIAGGIAEAFYNEIPAAIITQAAKRLPQEFVVILKRFYLEKMGITLSF